MSSRCLAAHARPAWDLASSRDRGGSMNDISTPSHARAEKARVHAAAPRASTGVEGLDEILGGGLTRNRVYLLEGTPGTGKTTFALRFLIEGSRRGERGLYITLSETAEELAAVVGSHGWSLDGIDVFELADESGRDPDAEQSILYPSEVELGETIRTLTAQIDRIDAGARRLRQPVGDAPAGAGPAALPAPGAGAQAVLRDPLVHRAAARRQDLGAGRPAAAQHLARRHQPRAGDPAVRHREPAPARRQDARPEVPGRPARLHPRHRAGRGLPAPGRFAPSLAGRPRPGRNGLDRARPDARRRPDARHQHAAARPVGRRQDDDRRPLHARRPEARRARDLLPLRRGHVDAAAAQPDARHGHRAVRRRAARATWSRSIRRSCRRASSPPSSSTPSTRTARRSSPSTA